LRPVEPIGEASVLNDANCLIGRYPFRRLPFDDIGALLTKLDELGVERAAAARLEAIFYRSPQVANEELFSIVVAHPDRFWPVVVINPTLPGWQDDFARCADLGAVAVRLHPNYHGYSPVARDCIALVERARDADLPIIISLGIEDLRHQHPIFHVANVPTSDVAMLINFLPDASYLIAGATYGECVAIEGSLARPMNVHFELSRVQGPVGDVDRLAARVGPTRLLYGSNLPLHVPEAAKLSIDHADLPDADKELIRHGNADRLFGRK
jgi:predicted TIM-barrel fold metal-dependent hydrolase